MPSAGLTGENGVANTIRNRPTSVLFALITCSAQVKGAVMEDEFRRIWEEEHRAFSSTTEEVSQNSYEAYVPNQVKKLYLRWMDENQRSEKITWPSDFFLTKMS